MSRNKVKSGKDECKKGATGSIVGLLNVIKCDRVNLRLKVRLLAIILDMRWSNAESSFENKSSTAKRLIECKRIESEET